MILRMTTIPREQVLHGTTSSLLLLIIRLRLVTRLTFRSATSALVIREQQRMLPAVHSLTMNLDSTSTGLLSVASPSQTNGRTSMQISRSHLSAMVVTMLVVTRTISSLSHSTWLRLRKLATIISRTFSGIWLMPLWMQV